MQSLESSCDALACLDENRADILVRHAQPNQHSCHILAQDVKRKVLRKIFTCAKKKKKSECLASQVTNGKKVDCTALGLPAACGRGKGYS